MLTADMRPVSTSRRAPVARRFRHVMAIGVGILGVALLGGTGLAFLATNGTTSATITAGGLGSTHEFSAVYKPGDTLPTGVAWQIGGATATQTNPWQPILNQPVAANNSNDVALVDGTGVPSGHNLMVTLTLSNVVGMSTDYSYANIPIVVEKCVVTSGACVWTTATDAVTGNAIGTTILNLTNGYLTFLLQGAPSTYYEIESTGSSTSAQGSFYLAYTSGSGDANLGPTYAVAVSAAG